MAELKDYSGEYKPDLKLEDFSKDFLIRLMHAWASAYLRVDEMWYRSVAERTSAKEAFNCQLAAWLRIAKINAPKIARSANIQVNDIVDFLKVTQVIPDGVQAGVFEAEFDIRSRNHVILTITRCRTLEFLEKNAPERIVSICHGIDIPINERYLAVFLPDAKFPPLKLPDGPRKSPDEAPCIWELRR